MQIGAHVSTAGGIDKAIGNAQKIGAECVQIFASAPQSWRYKHPAPETISSFKDKPKTPLLAPSFSTAYTS